VGLNEADTASPATNEAIYFYFNRVIDGGFGTIGNYQLSTDGGNTFTDLAGPTWTATITADDNNKNTIVKLEPAAGATISGENKYAIKLKKDTATSDGKKLAQDVIVYFATEAEKPTLDSTNPLQTYDAATAGSLADVGVGTTAAMANRGLAIKFADAGSGNKVLISSINGENIKIQDMTADGQPVRTGVFYENITNGDVKALLSSTAGASTDDATIFWFPATDADKFVAGHQYKITISGIKDSVGNPMAAPYIAYFTIADTAAPTVVSTSVANGAEGVSVEPTFTVTFSKAVTNGDTAGKITLGAVPIKVTMSTDKKTATVTPLVYLAKLATYTLHIDKTITDGTTEIGMDTDIAFTTENVTKKAAIQSATWNGTAKTLTIVLDKPVKAGKTVVIGDIITSAQFGTTPTVSISTDRKTIVVQADSAGTTSVVPAVHAISFKTDGNAVLSDDSNYKQNVDTIGNQTGENSITIQ